LSSSTNKLVLDLNSKTDCQIEIHRLYFPGWQFFLDGKKLELGKDFEISKSIQIETESTPYIDRSGFPVMKIRAGKHLLKAQFYETPLRKLGFILTFCGFGFSLLFLLQPEKFSKAAITKRRKTGK